MAKHHHQTKPEQLYNKSHGSSPFHYEKPHQSSETRDADRIQTTLTVDDRSIQRMAYQIHQERGGTDFDNWLEAERILKNT